MNTRHIQSFLIVSAAFFAMTGPAHAQSASALAAAGAQMRQIVPAQDAAAQLSAERAAESKANVR
ncbi:hypothetical protein [Burkholderia cenocepacia]|uniref:DUF4148 domain-containing protein n=1 Tax=Burkholderia cenocepacia TaxID=95486 RepID=A0A3Q9F5E1_9BURK|nr:hypothetical protein [Burkholderia cenocepacia]AZQ49768.1 hypothetical protein D5R55_01350 [Burkholderia cenocepacia]